MELKKDICPHCGETETVYGKQFGQGSVVRADAFTLIFGIPLYHVICRTCGTVIRSYVESTERLQ